MEPIYVMEKAIRNKTYSLNDIEKYLTIENNLLLYNVAKEIAVEKLDTSEIRKKLLGLTNKVGDNYMDGGYSLGGMAAAALKALGDFNTSTLPEDEQRQIDSLWRYWDLTKK